MSPFARTLLAAAALAALVADASAQTLYGTDGSARLLWEIPSSPGGPCGAPNPPPTACSDVTAMCGAVIPFPVPAGALEGDVAVNSLTDRVYVTDGFNIVEYNGDDACGAPPPCTPLNAFRIPTSLVAAGMGPLTGMGMDETGTWSGGSATLYITDGKMLAGILPPTTPCGPSTLAFGPCVVPNPNGVPFTDLTWDPLSSSLWACDVAGFVHQIQNCVVVYSFNATGSCGLSPFLTGVAFDLGSGRILSPGGPALYVTDGNQIAYVDLTGAPATPTFYSPTPCTPAPAFLHGLAFASHGISYGFPRASARCGTFGQASAPGPTFGLEYSGVPQGLLTVLFINTSFPGPGYFCPPVPGVGTNFWVDPTGFLFVLGPSAPACTQLPLPIPATAPTGVNVFFQFLFVNSSFVAVDATQGCAFTITAP